MERRINILKLVTLVGLRIVVNLFRETETDRLKKDADDMEARLLQLQDKMRTQMGEGGAQAGSGKWSSARTDKGSIRAYGKEVNDKVKKKLEATGGGDPAMRSTLSSKRPTKAAEVDFKSKGMFGTVEFQS